MLTICILLAGWILPLSPDYRLTAWLLPGTGSVSGPEIVPDFILLKTLKNAKSRYNGE